MLEIQRATTILVILLTPAFGWSQAQLTDDSNPPEYGQQSSTSQSNPAPPSPPDKATVAIPDQAPDTQNKKDDSQAQQTKRMFWVVPNFGAVNANTQLPPMSTREKFVLASQDSVVDYSSYTWPESWLDKPCS